MIYWDALPYVKSVRYIGGPRNVCGFDCGATQLQSVIDLAQPGACCWQVGLSLSGIVRIQHSPLFFCESWAYLYTYGIHFVADIEESHSRCLHIKLTMDRHGLLARSLLLGKSSMLFAWLF